MYGMKKTTIYLPDDLKERVETVAKDQGLSEANLIREAIATAVNAYDTPEPRLPLTPKGLGDPTIAERAEDLLENFGR